MHVVGPLWVSARVKAQLVVDEMFFACRSFVYQNPRKVAGEAMFGQGAVVGNLREKHGHAAPDRRG